MKFTPAARKLLDMLPDDRRATVGNWAKKLALSKKARSVQKHHVVSAIYLADESHLPEEADDDPRYQLMQSQASPSPSSAQWSPR